MHGPLVSNQSMPPVRPGPRPHLAVIQIALVYVAVRAFWMISDEPWVARQSPVVEALVKIALWVVPCVLLLALGTRRTPRASWRDLGLGGAPWRGVGFALVATAPMAIALAFAPGRGADFDLLVDTVIVGPFAEEVLFRGFLCLQLVALAGWRIGPAIAVSSAMFALAHLPHVDVWLLSGAPLGLPAIGLPVMYSVETVGTHVAPYAFGGVLFAWIAWRWQSLWPAVALHACLNLWWALAQGGARLQFDITPMTVGHTLAIALAIGLTLARPGVSFASTLERA